MNLLFPNGKECVREIPADTYRHLALDELVDMIAVTAEDKKVVKDVLTLLPLDERTTLYRQEILKDLLDNEELCTELEEIIKELDILKEFKAHSYFTIQKKSSLWDLINYMGEMEIYTKIIEGLVESFSKHQIKSSGLLEIANLLKDIINEDRVEQLKEIINSLHADMSALKSVSVGINLTPELYPEEVIISSYNNVPYLSQFDKTAWGISIHAQKRIRYREPSQFMKYICDDMEKHLSKTVQKSKSELKKYINLKGYFLLDICDDLKYYLLITRFARKLTEVNYTICMPTINNEADKVSIKGIYNIRLTARKVTDIVKNDFLFTNNEKLFVLTGPNRGGKTMLTQAVGINALLAAQGMFVTADEYEGYLFDNVLTHFPADENETLEFGRLGEEAVRVQHIVKEATDRTLVLLNETYSSTSAYDGLYMATDLVHILKHNDVAMIFNTHIHELAHELKDINKWDGNSDVVSLTMEIQNNVNTFRVLKKEPDRNSYARNIAEKYGVTYEQMLSQ